MVSNIFHLGDGFILVRDEVLGLFSMVDSNSHMVFGPIPFGEIGPLSEVLWELHALRYDVLLEGKVQACYSDIRGVSGLRLGRDGWVTRSFSLEYLGSPTSRCFIGKAYFEGPLDGLLETLDRLLPKVMPSPVASL